MKLIESLIRAIESLDPAFSTRLSLRVIVPEAGQSGFSHTTTQISTRPSSLVLPSPFWGGLSFFPFTFRLKYPDKKRFTRGMALRQETEKREYPAQAAAAS